MNPTGSPIASPITILIDSNESHPFGFTGIVADEKQDYRPVTVPTEWRSLGRYPDSLGDYSAEGLVGYAHVERKSMEDAQSTVLGWETEAERAKHAVGRRDRFEKELENLGKIPLGVVIVEASLHDCLTRMPSWGKKPRQDNAKIFFRSVNAYLQDHPVPWLFCDTRRMAEQATYRWLWRAWRKREERRSSNPTKPKSRP